MDVIKLTEGEASLLKYNVFLNGFTRNQINNLYLKCRDKNNVSKISDYSYYPLTVNDLVNIGINKNCIDAVMLSGFNLSYKTISYGSIGQLENQYQQMKKSELEGVLYFKMATTRIGNSGNNTDIAEPEFTPFNTGKGGTGKGKLPGSTVDPNTGSEVGRFISDGKGNVMIEPVGGKTVPAGKNGIDTHTTYPNGSNYQRLNPEGHVNNSTPHGHGHLEGTGPGMKGQGPSIDVNGVEVPWNSSGAHWSIN